MSLPDDEHGETSAGTPPKVQKAKGKKAWVAFPDEQPPPKARKTHQKRRELPEVKRDTDQSGTRFEWRHAANKPVADWLRTFLDELDGFEKTTERKAQELKIASECLKKFQFPGETDGDMTTVRLFDIAALLYLTYLHSVFACSSRIGFRNGTRKSRKPRARATRGTGPAHTSATRSLRPS